MITKIIKKGRGRRRATFSRGKQVQPINLLIFPIQNPIFPNMMTNIPANQNFCEFMLKKNIKCLGLFPISPGINYTAQYYPESVRQLQELIYDNKESKIYNSAEDLLTKDMKFIRYKDLDSYKQKNDIPMILVKSRYDLFYRGTLCWAEAFKIERGLSYIQVAGRYLIQFNQAKNFNEPFIFNVNIVESKKKPLSNYLLSLVDTLDSLYEQIGKYKNQNNDMLFLSVEERLHRHYVNLLTKVFLMTYQEKLELLSLDSLERRGKICIQIYKREIEFLKKSKMDLNFERDNTIVRQQGKSEKKSKNQVDLRKEIESRPIPPKIKNMLFQELQTYNQKIIDGTYKLDFINNILKYPWGKFTLDQFNIAKARDRLQQQHYAMNFVKTRILQFIAVANRTGIISNKVILLNGPPGVGKTSIAMAIAKCIGRPFYRISLGGQYDQSIIKGHRRTFVGAYPGKIYEGMKTCMCENPVIILDEIDKVSKDTLNACLNELLDSQQNTQFKDSYTDIEIDLSKVLFICTSNQKENIYKPLLNRMEIIQIPGYSTNEKKQIFKRYLKDKGIIESGFPNHINLQFDEQGIQFLINYFSRQSGIRELERSTNSIFRKIVYKIVKGQEINKCFINRASISELLGKPKFPEKISYQNEKYPGIIAGLSYSSRGGDTLYIESQYMLTQTSISQQLIITGNISQMIKQSCQVALNYAKHFLNSKNIQFKPNKIHINFPDLEIGKDGPSAGIAITTSLISMALQKCPRESFAMTGQITLNGDVGIIGGVKSKIIGAQRQNIRNVILPLSNRRDVQEISKESLGDLNIYYVSKYQEVYNLLFDNE